MIARIVLINTYIAYTLNTTNTCIADIDSLRVLSMIRFSVGITSAPTIVMRTNTLPRAKKAAHLIIDWCCGARNT
jgi:hypothetical protein